MTERVIESGEEPTDWTLLVTADGDLVARRKIPYDGVLRFSTATRALPTGRRTRSEFGLDLGTVIDRYLSHADTTTPRPELVDDVQAALGAVSQENTDSTDIEFDSDSRDRGSTGASGGDQ